MDGIRKISRAYYERASEDEKKAAKEFFRRLDANGNGKVSLREFKKSVSSWLSDSWLSDTEIFKQFDTNRDGSLDFYDVLALYYMVKKIGAHKCNACRVLLVDPYFSCLLCIENGDNSFDLCCSCYRGEKLKHHQHSLSNFLDNHTLFMQFKFKVADAQKVQKKKEMEEIREIAKAHYRAGSPQVQALAYQFYQSMDTNGDGRVDLSEFLAFMRQEGYTHISNPCFFSELDSGSNGALDFYDVMTLYYIIKSGRPFCGFCGKFIPGIFFSCVECFKNPGTSFDLCRDCYTSSKCNHNHNGRTQFLDNYTLLQTRKDPAPLAQASGMNSTQALITSSNATVPVQHSSMYIHTCQTYNTYIVHPPNQAVNHSNAVVPASNWNKWKAALKAFEMALSIGSISSTLCTIL